MINSRQFGMKVQFPEEYRYPDVVYEVGSRHCTHAGVWLVRLRCCRLFQIHFPREQKGNAETRCRGGGSGCCVHAHAIVWGVARVRGGAAPLHDPGPAVLTLSPKICTHAWLPLSFKSSLTLTIGGERIELHHAMGETDDGTWVWLPDRKVCLRRGFMASSPLYLHHLLYHRPPSSCLCA